MDKEQEKVKEKLEKLSKYMQSINHPFSVERLGINYTALMFRIGDSGDDCAAIIIIQDMTQEDLDNTILRAKQFVNSNGISDNVNKLFTLAKEKGYNCSGFPKYCREAFGFPNETGIVFFNDKECLAFFTRKSCNSSALNKKVYDWLSITPKELREKENHEYDPVQIIKKMFTKEEFIDILKSGVK